jgi:hypothetical protein
LCCCHGGKGQQEIDFSDAWETCPRELTPVGSLNDAPTLKRFALQLLHKVS